MSTSNEIKISATGPGGNLLITFSSVNSNGFSFFKAVEDVQESKIFVRDSRDLWYQFGTGQCTSSLLELAETLRSIVGALRPKRVVALGSSMGAYAALVFGGLLNVDTIVAVSPQTIIDPRLPHTPKTAFSDSPFFDLRTHLSTRRAGATDYVFFGSADLVDIYNVTRVGWRNARMIGVADEDHLVATHLVKSGELAECVRSSLSGVDYRFPGLTDPRVDDEEVCSLCRDAVAAFYLGVGQDPEAVTRRLLAMQPEWSAPHYLLANILLKAGDLAGAEEYARRATLLSPRSVTLADYHAAQLVRAERFDEAVVALRKTLSLRPKHYAALCNLGYVFARLGRQREAEEALLAAESSRPRLDRAGRLLKQLRAGQIGGPGGLVAEDM